MDKPEPFVLDLDSNPHPKMLEGALHARKAARQFREEPNGLGFVAFWDGYLTAMEHATGCTTQELVKWLDRHETER